MGLIEFLLKNWFFVVIALVILNNIWKNAKGRAGDDGSRTAPKQAMPPFGGDGGGVGGWGKNAKQPAITKAKQSAIRSEESPAPMLQNAPPLRGSGGGDRVIWDEFPSDDRLAAANTDRKLSSAAQPSQQDSLSVKAVNPNTLAQGVMWAEILGPPRAKKPFRR